MTHRPMRRAIFLIEVVAVLPLLAAVGLITTGLIVATARTSGRLGRWSNRDAKIAAFIGQLRADMDHAGAVEPAGALDAGVIIRRSDGGVITYRGNDGRVSRTASPADNPPASSWSASPAAFAWTVERAGETPLLILTITLKPDGKPDEVVSSDRVMTVTFAPGLAPAAPKGHHLP